MAMKEYARDAESLVDVLRKSISQPGTCPLLAAVVRMAIGMDLPTAFPPVDHRDSKLHELTERTLDL